jgi:hypothetical protein
MKRGASQLNTATPQRSLAQQLRVSFQLYDFARLQGEFESTLASSAISSSLLG